MSEETAAFFVYRKTEAGRTAKLVIKTKYSYCSSCDWRWAKDAEIPPICPKCGATLVPQ